MAKKGKGKGKGKKGGKCRFPTNVQAAITGLRRAGEFGAANNLMMIARLGDRCQVA